MSSPSLGAGAGDELAALAAAYWERRLRAHPLQATQLGDRRHDARLRDNTPAGLQADRTDLESFRRRAEAVDARSLDGEGRLTHGALLAEIDAELAGLDAEHERWSVDPLDGPQVAFLSIESYQPVRTPAEADAMVERWRAMAGYLDASAENLRAALREGLVACRPLVERSLEEIEHTLRQPIDASPLLRPAAVERPAWPPSRRADFADRLRDAVEDEVRPAFERFGEVLRTEILPAARPPERAGLVHLPAGEHRYRGLVRAHTSLDAEPEELHRIGLAEVERIDAETAELGERLFGERDRRAFVRRLRSDPELHFRTSEEVRATAEAALERANVAVPEWFGRLPRAACEVVDVPEHEEKHTTIAYYREPDPTGSRPGRYYVNTSEPQTRPRYEAEVLAFHEAVPGHHLQLAIAQELRELPAFRRFAGVTAFIEGWALYTERLSDEMGLYSGDLDRIGIRSFDAWRACRLVVDTGMHALGWSRQQAIEFLLEHTALAENNIVNEVDRYIAWPGQALAYKAGQLELARLRAEATARLGRAFDIRDFHDELLGHGALALGPLRGAVMAWVERRSGEGAS